MTDDVLDALPLSYTGITCLLGMRNFLDCTPKNFLVWALPFFLFFLQWHSWESNPRHVSCWTHRLPTEPCARSLRTAWNIMHCNAYIKMSISGWPPSGWPPPLHFIAMQWITHSHGHYPPRIWFWVWWKGRNLLSWLNWNSFRAWTSTIEIGCVAVEGIDIEIQLCRRRRRVHRRKFGVQRHFMI